MPDSEEAGYNSRQNEDDSLRELKALLAHRIEQGLRGDISTDDIAAILEDELVRASE
jgi:hypothetical protein